MMIASATMTALATDYTDRLLVLVNGEGSEQQATISVTEHDGLYDLNLRNFVLMNGDSPTPVGNVQLTDIVPAIAGDAVFLHANQMITVTEGDDASMPFWMGPMLGELPVDVLAVVEGNHLRALINLDLMAILEQIVEVRFGEALVTGQGYHIPNGDFEAWHTTTEGYEEPNAWHSFESASGSLAVLAGHHITKSDKGRNGSTCARIFATSIFGIVANGTMTTGRMNAGAFSASDSQNNAYLDMSKTDVDGNGDPFYVALNYRPDSLVFWMQFKQGTANANHPYATVSAVITDGTYFQDPQDKTYTNIVATASNRQMSVTNGEWQRIAVPFVYTDNNVEPRAIMVTISTNADAGQGSADDEVLVDDLTLVYSSRLANLNIEGFAPDKYEYSLEQDVALTPVPESRDAYVTMVNEESVEGSQTIITVYAADLLSATTYTVHLPGNAQGIAEMTSTSGQPQRFYTIDGRQLSSKRHGQLCIVRQADGRVVKFLRLR